MAIFMLLNKMVPVTEDQEAQSADLQEVLQYAILESFASKAVTFLSLRVFSHIQNICVNTVHYNIVTGDMLDELLRKISMLHLLKKPQIKTLLTISSSSKPNSKQSSSNSSSAAKQEGEFWLISRPQT